ncbi:hypothetical protein MHBO_001063 [Bonamia ostreae]|uniref:Uncharacterized protein n=1 Tax=Bonamia ostreae TaxID=126728 RepID=A0ABV2AHQ8_9EUKA
MRSLSFYKNINLNSLELHFIGQTTKSKKFPVYISIRLFENLRANSESSRKNHYFLIKQKRFHIVLKIFDLKTSNKHVLVRFSDAKKFFFFRVDTTRVDKFNFTDFYEPGKVYELKLFVNGSKKLVMYFVLPLSIIVIVALIVTILVVLTSKYKRKSFILYEKNKSDLETKEYLIDLIKFKL